MNSKTSTYLFLIFVIVLFLFPSFAKGVVMIRSDTRCGDYTGWAVLLKPGGWCAGYADPNDPRNMNNYCTQACKDYGYPRGGYGQCLNAGCVCGYKSMSCTFGSNAYTFCWYDVSYNTDTSCVFCYCYENTPPVVSTDKADVSVPNKSATLKGTITDNGGQNADLRGFDWGTSSGSYPNTWTEGTSGNYQYGTAAFSYNLTGLDPNIVYYYRAKAHNAKGWGYGIEMTLFAPIVSTQPAVPQAEQATLNGNLTDLGGAASVNVWFQWGLTTAYGNTTPSQAKTATGAFSALITGLTPNQTTYHFRAVVQDSVGKTSYGGDVSFVTTFRSPSGPGSYLYCGDSSWWAIKGGCSDAFCDNLCKCSGYTGGYPTACYSGCDPTCIADRTCSICGTSYSFCWCPLVSSPGTAVAQCWCSSAVIPTVTTETAVVDVQNNTATLKGNVTNTGGENPDHRYIDWDTDASGEPYTNTIDLGGGTGVYSTTINITSGTTYYYRARAHNSAGDGKGAEKRVVIYIADGGGQQFTTCQCNTSTVGGCCDGCRFCSAGTVFNGSSCAAVSCTNYCGTGSNYCTGDRYRGQTRLSCNGSGSCTGSSVNCENLQDCGATSNACSSKCQKDYIYTCSAGICGTYHTYTTASQGYRCEGGSFVNTDSCATSAYNARSADKCDKKSDLYRCNGTGATDSDCNYDVGDSWVYVSAYRIANTSGQEVDASSPDNTGTCHSCTEGSCSGTLKWGECDGLGNPGPCATYNQPETIYPTAGYTLTSTCGPAGTTNCDSNICWDGGGHHEKCDRRCNAAHSCDYYNCVNHCTNAIQDCDETGFNCGGSCPSCDVTPPTTTIKIIRTATGEDVTAAGVWLRADTYTIKFEDKDQADGSGSNCENCSLEYSIYSCDVGGTNCNTVVVPLASRTPNSPLDIVAGKIAPAYNLEGVGRYRIYSGTKDMAGNSASEYRYINFDFTPPRTEIK